MLIRPIYHIVTLSGLHWKNIKEISSAVIIIFTALCTTSNHFTFQIQRVSHLRPCTRDYTSNLAKRELDLKSSTQKAQSIMIWDKSVVADSHHCYERVSPIWKTNQSSCFRQCKPFPSITCGGAKFSSALICQPEKWSFINSSCTVLLNRRITKFQYQVRS